MNVTIGGPGQGTPDGADAWHPGGPVLVIDDDAAVLSVTRRQLERVGISAYTALDAEAAMVIFKEHQNEISAVLIDLSLRDLGGEQMLANLRALRPDMPALFISGELTSDALADDHVAYVAKPFRAANLVKALRSVMEDA